MAVYCSKMDESGRPARFPVPTTTLPFFIAPTLLSSSPSPPSWARGNWGFAVYRECQTQKTNERTAGWVGHGIRRLLPSTFYNLPPFLPCLRFTFFKAWYVAAHTSLGYFFLYLRTILFFGYTQDDEFQANEKKKQLYVKDISNPLIFYDVSFFRFVWRSICCV